MSILDDSLSHLETNAVGQPSVKTSQSPKGKRAFVFGAVALVVVMAVFISVKLTQTEQDISNKAAVDQGQVLVTSTASSLAVGQPTTVTLKANTQGVNVNGIQLTFTIDTSQSQPLTSPPTASIVASSGMTIAASAINQMPSGMYQVILYIVAPPPQFFSSTTPRDFATIVFTPTSSGTISFQFDNVDSLAPTANTGVDTLHTIQPMNFSVASNVSPTNTPIACPTAPTCGAGQTLIVIDPVNSSSCAGFQCSGSTSPTVTPHNDPTNTPVVLATATPVTTGGTCNSILVKNASTGAINNSPRRGDTLQFECGAINGAVRYEFQTKGPGQSAFVLLPAASNGARISQNYPITQSGDFVAQCRMCTGTAESTCQAWE